MRKQACRGEPPSTVRLGRRRTLPSLIARGIGDEPRLPECAEMSLDWFWPSYLSSVPRPDSGLTRCRSLVELVGVCPCRPVIVEAWAAAAVDRCGKHDVCPPPYVYGAQLVL